MSLIRYEPWWGLTRFQDQINNLNERGFPVLVDEESNIVTSHWTPAVDVKEENDRFIIHADFPGVNPNDIEVKMENCMLTIKGERESEIEEEKEGYKRVERSKGSFYRRFSLPDTADPDKISAKSKNGVLELVVPKHEVEKTRKISVKS